MEFIRAPFYQDIIKDSDPWSFGHVVNSNVPTAKFFAVRGIKEAVTASYAAIGLVNALALRDELFQLALANSRSFESFVLDSLCWVIAVITKRAWVDTPEEQRLAFTQTLCEDIVRHTTPCIGMITATYLIDEIAGGSKCSQFRLPWEFHYTCKTTFENVHMLHIFEAALKVIHRQLQRSAEMQHAPSGGSHTIAYERRSALHIADRVLNWAFTSSDESKVIAASFGHSKGRSGGGNTSKAGQRGSSRDSDNLDDGDGSGSAIFESEFRNRTPLFPRNWQSLLLSGEILTMFFSVYEATLSDQMHAYFSPGSTHLALQCLVQVSGIRGKDIFASADAKGSDELRAEFARVIMRNQLQMIRHVCSMDLVSEGSEDMVVATTQMIRRFIETQLEEPSSTVVANQRLHSLAFLVIGIPEAHEYFGEVSKFICMLLNSAAGILRSDMLQRVDDDFGDVDNYFVMQAFDELANAWSTVINQIREWEYLEEAAAGTNSGSNGDDKQVSNQSVLSSFTHFLVTTAYLIRSEYIQLRMLMCEDSVPSNSSRAETFSIDQGLLAKDYVVYEDQLQFFALLARLDLRTSLDRMYENLCSRCNALQEEFKSIESGTAGESYNQHTIDLLHEQTQWIVLMIGFTLCDSGTSERVLIPKPVLEYSAACSNTGQDLTVQCIMVLLKMLEFELVSPSSPLAAYGSPLLVETLFWALRRIAPVYFLLDRSDYREVSKSTITAFGSTGDGGNGSAIINGVLDLVKRTFDLWSAEEDVLQMCVSILLALGQRTAIAREITSSPQFTPLMQYFTSNIGQFPEAIHGSIIEALALLACHSSSADHERCFSDLKTLILRSFSQVVHSSDFMARHQDARLVNQLLGGLDMMDGLLSAANFRNMDAIFGLFFEVQPLFEQLLTVYGHGDEIPCEIIQVMESAARYLDVSSLPDDEHMLRFSHCFRTLLRKYQTSAVGRSTSQSDTDIESLSKITSLISAISYLVHNEMGFAPNEASPSIPKAVADDFGETEVFGLYCVHVTADSSQLLTPNVLRIHIQLISEMAQYRMPSLIRWLPTEIWAQIMDVLLAGIDHGIYDIGHRTYEAISRLGAYVKVAGIGNAPAELRDVFSRGFKQLLSKLLQALLFSPFDVELVEYAGTALVTLGLLDPSHLQTCFQDLFAQGDSAAFAERLSSTLTKFNSDLEASDAVRGLLKTVEPIPDPIDSAELRQPLFEFLVNTRAVLRIK
ncbi:hypothetical protein GGH17_000922 [Coemansia sp. RSA 788]|nr:hypothetical protein LPJ67_001067 [Coemansia sp. RSA 1938]KAJ2138803.1 hypothetical protein GGH17_000922 [Coemansia sp. RSA 788]KAJ2257384.1 hypothetical protein GGH98_000877 [Coemansia sp. RSA 454]